MKMAFDPEAKQLCDVLAGGYHLNAKLQALLGCPLDSRSQEEAMAFSQELSRVFIVSMSMLKHLDGSKRTPKTMATTKIRSTGGSFGVCTLAKDKLIRNGSRGGAVAPYKNVREAEFTRTEVTSEPHKDGYQWQKYGQKNIQNCNFMRYYFRCHDRRCDAKKKVQQQDVSSSGADDAPPVFEVAYVNEHTCQLVERVNNDTGSNKKPLATTTIAAARQSSLSLRAAENKTSGAVLFDLLLQENEAIVSCLATVISGTAPSSPGAEEEPVAPWPASSSASDPAAYDVPQLPLDGKQPPSADGGEDEAMMDTGFWWDPSSPSSFWPAEACEAMDLTCDDDDDLNVDDAARFVDTVWALPHYYT